MFQTDISVSWTASNEKNNMAYRLVRAALGLAALRRTTTTTADAARLTGEAQHTWREESGRRLVSKGWSREINDCRYTKDLSQRLKGGRVVVVLI